MKKNFVLSLLIFISALCCGDAHAQYSPPTFAVHITSPWAFPYKAGVKVEYRIYPENAFLLGFTYNYKYFPGFQGSLEYRLYFHEDRLAENIFYTKAGTGFADYQPSNDPFTKATDLNKAPGTYYFGGAGIGRHFNFGHFFMEFTAGLKFSYVSHPPAQYNEAFFYTLGPGSIPDINFHFGIQL